MIILQVRYHLTLNFDSILFLSSKICFICIFAEKSEKTDRTRISGAESKETGPQSPWGRIMPKEILLKIFEYVVASQGSLPSVIR